MTPGERLRYYRERRGWSQRRLGLEANIRQPVISEIESGKAQKPTLDTMLKLAKALGVSVYDLAEGEQYEELLPAVDEQPASIPVNGSNSLTVEVSC